jgi:aryl-alcohol dehydrogenase-like predicted oxidoreductase
VSALTSAPSTPHPRLADDTVGTVTFGDVTARRLGFGAMRVSDARGVSTQQVAVAWLLQRSALAAPIPGTSQLAHADDNVDTAWLRLTADEMGRLDAAGAGTIPVG